MVGPDMTGLIATVLPGGHSEWEPPDPFSNSEVKTLCADASVDFVDVKVGHCQALNSMKVQPPLTKVGGGFFVGEPPASHNARCRSNAANRPNLFLVLLGPPLLDIRRQSREVQARRRETRVP